jgi:valyl-tRNA synthetase
VEFWIPLTGLVDVGEEAKRLRKEIEKVSADITFVEGKLARESFTAKAPPELVAQERQKQHDLTAKRKELEAALHRLSKMSPE